MQTDNFYTDPAHVPLDQLRRYQADALPPAERHQVEKHLLDCDLCADLLEGLSASPAPVTQRAVQDLNHRLAVRLARKRNPKPFYTNVKNWGVAAAIFIFVLSGAVVVYYNLQNIKSAENAAALNASAPLPAPTILKPTDPVLTETKPNFLTADSILNNPVLALEKMQTTGSSAGQKNQVATAPDGQNYALSELEISNPAANAEEVVSGAAPVLNPDTPVVVVAPKPEVGVALSGRVAGVGVTKATKSRSSFQERKMSISGESAALTGRMVKGQVSDESGQGLPGVSVVIKGTTLGTVTDATGSYNLVLPEARTDMTLIFNYIGFTTTEKEVSNLNLPLALNVEMQPDTKALSEVVVVGYGTQAQPEVGSNLVRAKPATGFKAFRKYIGQNLKYPASAAANKIRGRVVVGFTVNPDGSLSDHKIIKSLSPACDAEALRLLREGPAWEPTKKDRVAVKEQVRLAIRFKPVK